MKGSFLGSKRENKWMLQHVSSALEKRNEKKNNTSPAKLIVKVTVESKKI